MNKDLKYDLLLFQEASRGRINSYINLSIILIPGIFSLVFKLVPNKDEAIKISSETFFISWRDISKIETLKLYKQKLEKVALLRCIEYLNKNQINPLNSAQLKTLEEQFTNPFSEIEKAIISLSTIERVIIVISDQLGLSAKTITKIYNGVENSKIPTILNKTRKLLITLHPSKYFLNYSEKQWEELNASIKKTETLPSQKLTTNEENSVREYNDYLKELMKKSFMNLSPNQQIINILNNQILDESNSIAEKKVQTTIDSTEIIDEPLIKNQNLDKNPRFKINKSIKIILLLVLFLVVSYAISTFIEFPTTWSISNESTNTMVNGASTNTSELSPGNVINTSKEKITIESSEKTTISLFEDTELKINKISSSESVFELKSGGIKFNSQNSSTEYFLADGINYIIKNSFSNLETRNAQFTFQYIDHNSFYLDTKYGWIDLKIIKNKSSAYCAGGYILDFNNLSVITVPYKKSSSERFIASIKQISKYPDDNDAFNYIMNNSTEDDILTLWHLLIISDSNKQGTLIDKFNELLITEFKTGEVMSKESKQNLLEFIRSALLMNSNN